MRAMVLVEPGPVEEQPLKLQKLPIPEPGPGQLLLKVRACGVCRTDLHLVEGELAPRKLPLIPGHEVVAQVAALGEGVEGFAVGDRVGVPWLHDTPADCPYRERGQENLCPDARFTGYHVDGGYAEYLLSEAEFTYPLPEGLGDVEAAPLLCAGVIGYRALRLSELKPGRVFGIYGFGGSAHIAIQIAVSWGCPTYVFTRGQSHRELAMNLGATWAGPVDAAAPEPLDSAVNFTPAGEMVLHALRNLRPGGTVACAGIVMSPIPEMDYSLLYGERTVRSVANSTRHDVVALLEAAERIPIRTTTSAYPLAEANEVLLQLKRSAIDGAAVLTP